MQIPDPYVSSTRSNTTTTSSHSITPKNDDILENNTNHHSFIPADALSIDDVNPLLIKAEYAIRGRIPTRANELNDILKNNNHNLPFDSIVFANIGNPQDLKQTPLTFNRQVLSLLQYPDLLLNPDISNFFNKSSIDRANSLLNIIDGNSLGAYSHCQGNPFIRNSVLNFIQNRDNIKSIDDSIDNIFLTGGASKAVEILLPLYANSTNNGVLIPIPQYPLYSALVTLNNATLLPYYLNELDNWSTDPLQIESIIIDSLKKNIKPTTLVVINPSNPTGSVLTEKNIIDILTIAAKYGIMIIADEVYQSNIYSPEIKFISFKKVLLNLQLKFPNLYKNVQLASLHSTSKGLNGECGQRGGYMEAYNFPNSIHQLLIKSASLSICSNITGQILVNLMVNPPNKNDLIFNKHQNEMNIIHNDLNQKAISLFNLFNNLPGITCEKPTGAMYLFPRLHLSKNFINLANSKNIQPDELYCLELLENTGICTVPGSGFGQINGTYHLRTTFLPPGTDWIKNWETFHLQFMKTYA